MFRNPRKSIHNEAFSSLEIKCNDCGRWEMFIMNIDIKLISTYCKESIKQYRCKRFCTKEKFPSVSYNLKVVTPFIHKTRSTRNNKNTKEIIKTKKRILKRCPHCKLDDEYLYEVIPSAEEYEEMLRKGITKECYFNPRRRGRTPQAVLEFCDFRIHTPCNDNAEPGEFLDEIPDQSFPSKLPKGEFACPKCRLKELKCLNVAYNKAMKVVTNNPSLKTVLYDEKLKFGDVPHNHNEFTDKSRRFKLLKTISFGFVNDEEFVNSILDNTVNVKSYLSTMEKTHNERIFDNILKNFSVSNEILLRDANDKLGIYREKWRLYQEYVSTIQQNSNLNEQQKNFQLCQSATALKYIKECNDALAMYNEASEKRKNDEIKFQTRYKKFKKRGKSEFFDGDLLDVSASRISGPTIKNHLNGTSISEMFGENKHTTILTFDKKFLDGIPDKTTVNESRLFSYSCAISKGVETHLKKLEDKKALTMDSKDKIKKVKKKLKHLKLIKELTRKNIEKTAELKKIPIEDSYFAKLAEFRIFDTTKTVFKDICARKDVDENEMTDS